MPFLSSIKEFKFLHVGKTEPRKSTCELLQAFDIAFEPNDPVRLIMSCHNPHIPNFNSVKFIENMCLKNREKIVVVNPVRHRKDVAALYRSSDAFIYPSRAEGWGFPPLEAMACGLPVAITHYSGRTAFANEENSLPIPFSLEPMDPNAIPHFARTDNDFGQWASPSVDGLVRVMKEMFTNKNFYETRARTLVSKIHAQWSWSNAAKIATKRLLEISKI